MAQLDVIIDIPDLSAISGSSFFSEFYAHLASTKATAEKKIKDILLNYAREGHRSSGGRHYQDQYGRLKKSTKVEGSLTTEIRLYVDTTQLDDYAGWIVSGKRKGANGKTVTWNGGKGDPFIDETIEANKVAITEIIIKYYTDAIMLFNSRS